MKDGIQLDGSIYKDGKCIDSLRKEVSVKRYDIYPEMVFNEEQGSELELKIEPYNTGDWVRYEDVKPLIDALRFITVHETECESCDVEVYYKTWLYEIYKEAKKALKDIENG
jgi:hypothetical protein